MIELSVVAIPVLLALAWRSCCDVRLWHLGVVARAERDGWLRGINVRPYGEVMIGGRVMLVESVVLERSLNGFDCARIDLVDPSVLLINQLGEYP